MCVCRRKEEAHKSFAQAFFIEPMHEAYATTMFVINTSTENNSATNSLRQRYSQNTSLVNFKIWQEKQIYYENAHTNDNHVEDAENIISETILNTTFLETGANVTRLLEIYGANISFDMILLTMFRENLKDRVATLEVCREIQQQLGSQMQRIGLMYQFPKMLNVVSKMPKILRNISQHLDMFEWTTTWHKTEPLIESIHALRLDWSFKLISPDQEQHFPVFLVNQIVSVCHELYGFRNSSSRFLSVLHLTQLMDVSAVNTLLNHSNDTLSLVHVQDAFGNTPAFIAACQRDIQTLTVLVQHGANLHSHPNMWGNTAADVILCWLGW